MRKWKLAFTAAALALLAGCGDNLPKTVPVEGRVSYKGKPVANGTICFQPVELGAGQPVSGEIKPDGSYKLRMFQAKDGIMPGKYAVSIRGCNSTDFIFDPNAKPDYSVPLKYIKPETSGLTVEVPADSGGTLRFDFELKD